MEGREKKERKTVLGRQPTSGDRNGQGEKRGNECKPSWQKAKSAAAVSYAQDAERGNYCLR